VQLASALIDALSADPRVSVRIDRATVDRLTSPKSSSPDVKAETPKR
jgi:hypothetical protein